MPRQARVRGNHPVIVDNGDGTVSIAYEPKEEGLHEMNIKYNGEHIKGSPMKIYVDSISSGYVTAYGTGLVQGICGEPCNFTISTKDAGSGSSLLRGRGGLSLAVEGPSKSEITCHDNKDDTVSVSYLPTSPGEYKVTAKYMEKHIKGSPFSVKVTGEGRKRNQISVTSNSQVTLPVKVPEKEVKLLNASIQAPSGLEEPVFLKRKSDGSLEISFTPREEGNHNVSVKKAGSHIFKSPFSIHVGELEVGDAKKVTLGGKNLKEGKTHADNEFTVDTRTAGYGGLSISMEGPSKADLSYKTKDDGELVVFYKPYEPGFYILNIKFADHHITHSPFTVKVTGEGTNQQVERIKRDVKGVTLSEVGNPCRLSFKMPGVSAFELSAIISSPGGVGEDAEIGEIDDGFYAVFFTPKELGMHIVSVKFRDIHIPGSPFQYTVGPLRDYGAHRVHAGGPGLEKGEVKTYNEFNVWTREAGAGAVAVSVEGPSKADIKFIDRNDGTCFVSYMVAEPGEYRVGVKFNELHVPDSPYKVYVSPQLGDAKKVEIGQFPDTVTTMNKPIAFIVSKNGAKGQLECKAVAPSGAEDDCFTAPIDDDTYAVRYLPKENGIHFFHVRLNGVHIPGSPVRLKIGKDEADPAAVGAQGNGLRETVSGQKTDFIIDTSAAGSGTLAVTIDGPSKVSMDCTEVENGYKVRYTPLAPGDYYVSVKYNSYHIAGSPYRVRCTGQAITDDTHVTETSSVIVETTPKQGLSGAVDRVVLPKFTSDASKVKTKGMGLKKAYMHKQNQLVVQADEAGQNLLYCFLIGPKEEPCGEMHIKHTGKQQYNVSYVVHERGDHLLVIKWGDDHIPGSPFKVEVP